MRRAIPRIKFASVSRPICRPVRQFTTAFPKRADESIQEVLRRKIWGTDQPPGAPGTPPPPPQIPVVEEDAADDIQQEGYVEESDGRALPVVGLEPGLTGWEVPTFASVSEAPSTEGIHAAVHRAAVEVYTHVFNGKPAETPALEGSIEAEGFTSNVRIEVKENGEAAFDYGHAGVESDILNMSTGENAVPGSWLQEGLEGKGWVQLGFRGDEIKFAVYKRVYQLTGIRVADPEITRTKTVADLLTHLVAKPPPEKLFDLLATTTELPALPNVKMIGQRIRPWDRERAIGREQPFEKAIEYRYPFEEAEK